MFKNRKKGFKLKLTFCHHSDECNMKLDSQYFSKKLLGSSNYQMHFPDYATYEVGEIDIYTKILIM